MEKWPDCSANYGLGLHYIHPLVQDCFYLIGKFSNFTLSVPDIEHPIFEDAPRLIRKSSRLKYATKRERAQRRINIFIKITRG